MTERLRSLALQTRFVCDSIAALPSGLPRVRDTAYDVADQESLVVRGQRYDIPRPLDWFNCPLKECSSRSSARNVHPSQADPSAIDWSSIQTAVDLSQQAFAPYTESDDGDDSVTPLALDGQPSAGSSNHHSRPLEGLFPPIPRGPSRRSSSFAPFWEGVGFAVSSHTAPSDPTPAIELDPPPHGSHPSAHHGILTSAASSAPVQNQPPRCISSACVCGRPHAMRCAAALTHARSPPSCPPFSVGPNSTTLHGPVCEAEAVSAVLLKGAAAPGGELRVPNTNDSGTEAGVVVPVSPVRPSTRPEVPEGEAVEHLDPSEDGEEEVTHAWLHAEADAATTLASAGGVALTSVACEVCGGLPNAGSIGCVRVLGAIGEELQWAARAYLCWTTDVRPRLVALRDANSSAGVSGTMARSEGALLSNDAMREEADASAISVDAARAAASVVFGGGGVGGRSPRRRSAGRTVRLKGVAPSQFRESALEVCGSGGGGVEGETLPTVLVSGVGGRGPRGRGGRGRRGGGGGTAVRSGVLVPPLSKTSSAKGTKVVAPAVALPESALVGVPVRSPPTTVGTINAAMRLPRWPDWDAFGTSVGCTGCPAWYLLQSLSRAAAVCGVGLRVSGGKLVRLKEIDSAGYSGHEAVAPSPAAACSGGAAAAPSSPPLHLQEDRHEPISTDAVEAAHYKWSAVTTELLQAAVTAQLAAFRPPTVASDSAQQLRPGMTSTTTPALSTGGGMPVWTPSHQANCLPLTHAGAGGGRAVERVVAQRIDWEVVAADVLRGLAGVRRTQYALSHSSGGRGVVGRSNGRGRAGRGSGAGRRLGRGGPAAGIGAAAEAGESAGSARDDASDSSTADLRAVLGGEAAPPTPMQCYFRWVRLSRHTATPSLLSGTLLKRAKAALLAGGGGVVRAGEFSGIATDWGGTAEPTSGPMIDDSTRVWTVGLDVQLLSLVGWYVGVQILLTTTPAAAAAGRRSGGHPAPRRGRGSVPSLSNSSTPTLPASHTIPWPLVAAHLGVSARAAQERYGRWVRWIDRGAAPRPAKRRRQ